MAKKKLKKVIKGLKKASNTHAEQAKTLESIKLNKGGLLDEDEKRMGYADGEEVSISEKRTNAFINKEISNIKEYGKDYFDSGTGFLSNLKISLGDSGKGKRVVNEIMKVNKGMLKEEAIEKVNKAFEKAGLDNRVGKLTGGQVKLDEDKDGELTADDFEALRERTQKQMGGMMEGMPLDNEEEMQEPMAEKTVSEEMQEELEPLPEEPMEEPMMSEESKMDSDDVMEDKYLDFVINQALSEEEEEMLMNELENNPDLSLVFDKVMDVAQEFSGSGPVEGPGSEVSDSIPARLSDGEFVFTAKAVEEIGADTLMSMMKEAEVNADERQQVAYGGTVTTTVRQEEDDYDFGANPEEQELRNAAVSEQMRNLNPRLR